MQSANKMCVALLFGGMSSEHEVSCVSVGNFVRNIDRSKYEVLTVGMGAEAVRSLLEELDLEKLRVELRGKMEFAPLRFRPSLPAFTVIRWSRRQR